MLMQRAELGWHLVLPYHLSRALFLLPPPLYTYYSTGRIYLQSSQRFCFPFSSADPVDCYLFFFFSLFVSLRTIGPLFQATILLQQGPS